MAGIGLSGFESLSDGAPKILSLAAWYEASLSWSDFDWAVDGVADGDGVEPVGLFKIILGVFPAAPDIWV